MAGIRFLGVPLFYEDSKDGFRKGLDVATSARTRIWIQNGGSVSSREFRQKISPGVDQCVEKRFSGESMSMREVEMALTRKLMERDVPWIQCSFREKNQEKKGSSVEECLQLSKGSVESWEKKTEIPTRIFAEIFSDFKTREQEALLQSGDLEYRIHISGTQPA